LGTTASKQLDNGICEKKANEEISATEIGMDPDKQVEERVLRNFILTDNLELEGVVREVAYRG
jgi:hypothetical protein